MGRKHLALSAALLALLCATLFLSPSPLFARDADDNTPATAPSSQPAPDKSIYSLFYPTPANLLREFNPDRPDQTEGPYTVDAGHLQLESSFAEYTHVKDQGTSSDLWSVAPTNLRLGLLNNLEADLIVDPYLNLRTASSGTSSATRANGFGDTQLRAKLNLWGNDGGLTAFGLLPFIQLPTANNGLGNRHVEGGLILPLQINLSDDTSIGVQAEGDLLRNDSNTGYGSDFSFSAVLDQHLIGPLAGYIEYVGILPIRLGETYSAYFDAGFTWLLSTNIQLDIGINKGLTRSAYDYDIFSGISLRW
jgi:hypothetical protein